MRVRSYTDGRTFVQRVTPLLVEREAENCLMLGDLAAFTNGGGVAEGALLAVVEGGDGSPIGVATMRPPHGIVLTRMGDAAVEALVDHLAAGGTRPPGAVGPAETVNVFADRWRDAMGATPRSGHRLGLYHLHRVVAPPHTPGVFRPAVEEDVATLVPWAEAFFRETGHDEEARPAVEQRLREKRLFVWCDPPDRVVSMAGLGGATPNGARVNFVYTPPEHRRRGYASASVAALSQSLLDGGRRVVFLFTNLDNPTPNNIYRSIGYEYDGEFRHVLFE
jgi:RimJ/RimL family protein N-acetyltransferase